LVDDILQKIAEENILSETAFFVNSGDEIELRWLKYPIYLRVRVSG
jgi:predicted PhzF superfamily epimerase YddE/YHI9